MTVRLPRYYRTRQRCKKWNLYLKLRCKQKTETPQQTPALTKWPGSVGGVPPMAGTGSRDNDRGS